MKLLLRAIVFAPCAALAFVLMRAMLELPPATGALAGQVTATLDVSGVKHPVTAVLLNFRGYDTLLEIAVLLLALLGILAVTQGRTALPPRPALPILQSVASVLAPLMVLVAGYLLWAGSHRPGGAFQAGSVLAAGGVLLHLARLQPAWIAPSPIQRAGLAGGFLLFVAVAAALLREGTMLQYPPAYAGPLILLIESGLTISLGLILAGLFLTLSEDEEAQP